MNDFQSKKKQCGFGRLISGPGAGPFSGKKLFHIWMSFQEIGLCHVA